MTEPITAKGQMEKMKLSVESGQIVSPSIWVDGALKLAVLLGDENDKLFNLQQEVAKEKVKLIEKGDSVSKAKTKVEAMDIYKECHIQKAFIERITETIRISKLRARLTEDERKGY